ncbi:hypothetical protein MD484_g1531, partial [Candolleomyces efflorescens]
MSSAHKRSSSQVGGLEERASPQRFRVRDLWSDEEHQSLDNDIIANKFFQIRNQRTDLQLLLFIMNQVEERTEVVQGDSIHLLNSNPTFKAMLVKAWQKGSFKEIRNHKILRAKASGKSHPILLETFASPYPQQQATVQSWSCDFKGTADETLFAVLKNYLTWTHRLGGIEGSPYANVVPIVNSSGTGKSKLVDQLGRKHCFVIPLCLRREGTGGYPPPDRKVRDWLIKKRSTEQELNAAVREPTDSRATHTIFAELMNDGGTFSTPPSYRKDFYTKVAKLATKFELETKVKPIPQGIYLESNPDVRAAASSLLSICGDDAVVVLSFDEAHELGARAPTQTSRQGITVLSQIIEGLRSVRALNIMGLFLSTSVKCTHIAPELQHEPSSRVANDERSMLPPITELGFDQFALPLDDPPTLKHVTTAQYVSHLGRPLSFAARWAAGDQSIQRGLLDFARTKLAPDSADRATKALACLAVRFAVEFRPRNGRQEDIERTLVKNHLRYCIDPGSRMVTIAPSEPLLAEAAFEEFYYHGLAAETFLHLVAHNVDNWGIHQGERGEFVMSLIWMAARDAAVVEHCKTIVDRRPWDPYCHSVISVTDFMKQLLPAEHHQELDRMRPSVGDDITEFEMAFKDCRLWCNHFIQVQDFDVINTKFLCALLSNGIGVLCAPNRAGIDLLWVGLKGDEICEENLVLILGQANNDRRYMYQSESDGAVFDAMNPVDLGICVANRSIPMIRIVFALASQVPSVTLATPPSQRRGSDRSDSFTSYDFWFAAVDPLTFGCVTSKEARLYRELLDSSGVRQDVFSSDYVTENEGGSESSAEEDSRSQDERQYRSSSSAARMAARDLTSHRWQSSDLVAHAFAGVLSIELSARILLVFLKLGVIEARRIDPVEGACLAQPDDWVSLCLHAALDSHAKHTSGATSQEKDPLRFSWSWTNKIEGSDSTCKEKAATFFNVIGTLAFLVACQLDRTFKDRHPYRNRFTTSPFVNGSIVGAHGQEFRVDIFSLPLTAFCANDLSEQGEPCTPTTSPTSVIRKSLNGNLQKAQSPLSPVGTMTSLNPRPPPASPQCESLLSSSTVPSSASTVHLNPSPSAPEHVLPPNSPPSCIAVPLPASLPSPQTPATSPVGAQPNDDFAQSLERLKQALQEQLDAPFSLSTDILPELDCGYLCNKYACFQGFGVTGEVKTTEFCKAIAQELVHVQQHGRAQPHLQFVLGIAKVGERITFIREDAIGTEEVTLNGKKGSGVLEIIRLALGLGVATAQMLGAHPGFELSDDDEVSIELKEDAPAVPTRVATDSSADSSEHSLFVTDSETSGGKRKRGPNTATSSKHPRLTPPLKYWAPSPVFFNINKQRYFLEHLAQGRRSITGRQTRVWCAYLELEPGDLQDPPPKRDGGRVLPSIHEDDLVKAKALLASKSRVFVGPYALKIQYADMDSPAMTNRIVENIQDRMRQNPEKGYKYLLVPEWIHRGDEVITAIRGFESVPPTVEKNYIRRQELVSVSLFKRTLGHYCSLGEVCRAVADGYRAILWLHETGYVHRDLSDGNLLLARETPTTFTGPHSKSVQYGGRNEAITLVRRRPHKPKDVFGLVHDLDMAALVQALQPVPSPPPVEPSSPMDEEDTIWASMASDDLEPQQERSGKNDEEVRLRHRTGTPPYMSVRILRGLSEAHCVHDDAESLFYVLYLFPFQHPLPANQCMYPGPLPRYRATLPHAIKKWAGGWNQDLEFLGLTKQAFFQDTAAVTSQLGSLDRLWTASNRKPEMFGLRLLVIKYLECYIGRHLNVNGVPPGDLGSLIATVETIDGIIGRNNRGAFNVPDVVFASSS